LQKVLASIFVIFGRNVSTKNFRQAKTQATIPVFRCALLWRHP